jgi:hypothetical protein
MKPKGQYFWDTFKVGVDSSFKCAVEWVLEWVIEGEMLENIQNIKHTKG